MKPKRVASIFVLLPACVCLIFAGCSREHKPAPSAQIQTDQSASAHLEIDTLGLVLTPHSGAEREDEEIRRCQERVRAGRNQSAALDRLGWAYVAKARASFDPGYYKLAELCAQCLEANAPGSAESLLLRAHVLHQEHHFREAEPIAQKLVATRGLPFDYAMLGDVLMDLGRVDNAVQSYQAMLDSRPDAQGYARAAQARWIKGDVIGAIDLMRSACAAISSRDSETAAWMQTRLATLLFQSGDKEAIRACETALALRPDYPPGLLLRGRMLMAQHNPAEAIDVLRKAVTLNPLPDYQWTLLEALREAHQMSEAGEIESRLTAEGERIDRRTYSLYLATQGANVDLAVRLAEQELEQRQDVFTHDALAWALHARGHDMGAWTVMQHALAEGTADARLFMHRAVIAASLGHKEAKAWLAQAQELSHMLLPSERAHLEQSLVILNRDQNPTPESCPHTETLSANGSRNLNPNQKTHNKQTQAL